MVNFVRESWPSSTGAREASRYRGACPRGTMIEQLEMPQNNLVVLPPAAVGGGRDGDFCAGAAS